MELPILCLNKLIRSAACFLYEAFSNLKYSHENIFITDKINSYICKYIIIACSIVNNFFFAPSSSTCHLPRWCHFLRISNENVIVSATFLLRPFLRDKQWCQSVLFTFLHYTTVELHSCHFVRILFFFRCHGERSQTYIISSHCFVIAGPGMLSC